MLNIIYCCQAYDEVKGVDGTRWFKYDQDCNQLVYTQTVPVIFEPPCIYSGDVSLLQLYS